MNNTNSLTAEVTIRRSEYRPNIIKGAIAHTLPVKPDEALSLMKQEVEKEISNQIMQIPFPQIRNVIVSFMRPYVKVERDYSQILSVQYGQNSRLEQKDLRLSQKISKGYQQKIKLQKILKCFQKAQGLKIKAKRIQQDIQDGQHQDLGRVLDKIKNDSHTQINSLRQGSSRDQREDIQRRTNQLIIGQLTKNKDLYQAKNKQFIDLDFTYSEIKQFSRQLQKIVPIILRCETMPDRKEDVPRQNFISYFKEEIKLFKSQLGEEIRLSQTWLQVYRNGIKQKPKNYRQNMSEQGQNDKQLEGHLARFSSIQSGIKQKIYLQLKQIKKIEEHIVQNLRDKTERNLRKYQDFVRVYTDVRQICNTQLKHKEYLLIISQEEKLLSQHLRTNCGLIVFYKPSRDYADFVKSLSTNSYIYQQFKKRIIPIKDALEYINEQHNRMYQGACQSQNSPAKLRRREVEQKKLLFERHIQNVQGQFSQQAHNNNYQYLTHLIVSLNRLMALCKK